MRRVIPTILVPSLLLLGATDLANAGPYEEGLAAHDRADYSMALRLWEPLARQGNPSAQTHVGHIYALGQGVPQNYAEAAKWYRIAADQGNASDQLRMGNLHSLGQGVPQNYAEAAKWYRLAADQGNAEAQYFLGDAYRRGQGVPQAYLWAHMWLNLAASAASREAFANLASMMRDQVALKMTASQIAEAQRLAAEWKPK